jgi:NAD(P)-dependent dehydrogenase (short-subunit alcohol dehydrogenase family)
VATIHTKGWKKMGANYLVIGGSSGIGKETAQLLADLGHEVYVGSRTGDSKASVSGAHHLQMDVTADMSALDSLPDTLQGLVYCPGTIRLKPFQRLTEDDFLTDFQINLLGAVRVIQASLPRMKKSAAGGAIVLFSTVAVKVGMPFHASIASAKAAVEGLTRSLAAEFAPRIRVNAIAPSLTDTPLAGDLLSRRERRAAAAERHPLKRVGEPRDIARLAAHLVSSDAAWTTGQIVQVDGGLSSLRIFK